MRMFRHLLLLVISFGLLAAEGRSAEPDWARLIEFRSSLAPESTLTIPITGWSNSERAEVRRLFLELHAKAPGLLARAAQPGPIMLYRTASDSPDHPAGAWSRRRHETSLIFRDEFFDLQRTKHSVSIHQNVKHADWLFVHEIAHLADPVDRIGLSRRWGSVVLARINRVEADLAREQMSVRDAMYKYQDHFGLRHGLPSVYAAVSRHEALAEYVTVSILQPSFEVPADIRKFLESHVFSAPPAVDATLAKMYRKAHLHYRRKQFDLAIDELSEALKRDPGFGMAAKLRGFVHVSAGHYRAAISDWTLALKLVPGDVRRSTRDILKGRVWARLKIKDWTGAIADYTALLRLNPGQGEYYLKRGFVWKQKKAWARAIEDFSRFLKLASESDPDRSSAYYHRGSSYARVNKWNNALADFKDAKRSKPGTVLRQRIERAIKLAKKYAD